MRNQLKRNLYKSNLITAASTSRMTFAIGSTYDIESFIENEGVLIFMEGTSLTVEEFDALNPDVQLALALTDVNGKYLFYTDVSPFLAKRIVDSVDFQKAETIKVFKMSDAIDKVTYLDVLRTRELTKFLPLRFMFLLNLFSKEKVQLFL